MSVRDLLEPAAKAAGITLKDNWGNFLEVDERGCCHCWFPHLDDGQALRLAAKLGISISFGHGAPTLNEPPKVVRVAAFAGWSPTAEEEVFGDVAAATRRAIVRAAVSMAVPA